MLWCVEMDAGVEWRVGERSEIMPWHCPIRPACSEAHKGVHSPNTLRAAVDPGV